MPTSELDSDMVDAIIALVKTTVNDMIRRGPSQFIYATWISAETTDANLSQIQLADGTTVRGVPKLANAGSVTALAAGKTVICVNPGNNKPLMIVDVIKGNILNYP